MPRIICLQHVPGEELGLLEPLLEQFEFQIQKVRLDHGEPIPTHLASGLIILGGPMSVYDPPEKFPTQLAEIQSIQKALDQRLPILGICLGAQLLAQALGGHVFRSAQPEFGWAPIQFSSLGLLDSVFLKTPSTLEVFHWHSDTFVLPSTATRLAESVWTPNQIFKAGNNAYGFQCHLEVTEPMIHQWISNDRATFTLGGGIHRIEKVTHHLQEKLVRLQPMAQKIFSRFLSKI
jgi:GMP synthase (glutamine-hydrolysing)